MKLKDGFDLSKDVPHIHNRLELKQFLSPMYIISDYLFDTDRYVLLYKRIRNLVRGCFPIKACREYPVKFKFYKNSTHVYERQLRHFLIDIILWRPFTELSDVKVLNENYIIDPEKIMLINNHINSYVIRTMRNYNLKTTLVNELSEEVVYGLRMIDLDFGLILGLNFSTATFINEYVNDDRIREIMECKLDSSAQPHEIENTLKNYRDEFIKILKSKKDNPLGIILRAGTGIKEKQLQEFGIADGLKPTLTGETITLPNSNSTLIRGADTPANIYIGATGARKSLAMNKSEMGKAGYFTKAVIELLNTLSVSDRILDCNTKTLIKYDIKNLKILKKLDGKYFKLSKSDDDYMLLNSNTDEYLIGKTVYVRSAAICALGDCVCSRCIGETAAFSSDIWKRYPSYESEEMTAKVSQDVLSAKHLLTTISEVLKFNDDFYKYFYLVCGEVYPLSGLDDASEDINDYAIYVDPDDIDKVDEMDDDSLYNTMIPSGRFYIRNIKHPEDGDIEIFVEDKEIYITERMLELMKKGKGLVPFKYLSSEDQLFELVILNNELTKPLYDIMNMINRISKDDNDNVINYTLDEFHNIMLDRIIESNIPVNAIACEFIINRIVRSVSRPYERPDFSKLPLEPYNITRVNYAVENNKSPLIGLTFQHVKSQLLSDEFFYDRNEPSYLDPLYKVNVPTDRLKKYIKMSRKNRRNRYIK